MNIAKRSLMVAGAVALAVLVGAVLTPKTAHAIVATMVNVVNDAAHPVPNRDVDNPAREPFVMTIDFQLGEPSPVGGLVSPPVSMGRKYVILSVSIDSAITKGTDATWRAGVTTSSNGNFVLASFAVPNAVPGFGLGGGDWFSVTQPVYLPADPGSTIYLEVDRAGLTGAGTVHFTLTGYSVAE